MRINQYVAAASGLSRRAADTAVANGRVSVDGRPAVLGEAVADGAEVWLDGHRLAAPPDADNHTYVILNKPVGYVSSHARQGSDPTLYELLPAEYHRLRLVGRLDRDSSGLVLLTSDGRFVQHYSHPSGGKDKLYELTLSKPLSEAHQQALAAGIQLDDGLSRVRVLSVQGHHVSVSLAEGRNRQLRRTFGQLGYHVQRLHRTQIGPFKLGQLPSGRWQLFNPLDPA